MHNVLYIKLINIHDFAGFSLITNVVITEHDSKKPPPNHQEVMETADRRAKDLLQLVKSIIGRMST